MAAVPADSGSMRRLRRLGWSPRLGWHGGGMGRWSARAVEGEVLPLYELERVVSGQEQLPAGPAGHLPVGPDPLGRPAQLHGLVGVVVAAGVEAGQEHVALQPVVED